MAVAGILATALTDRAVRAKGLYVGGVDVLFAPGSGDNRTGVPVDTISVTEAGPGGVSSMSFTIDDPTLSVTVLPGMEVRFQDIAKDYTIFFGWLQSYDVQPAFGDTGRTIKVEATGVEVVLDWGVTKFDLTFPAGSIVNTADAIQTIATNSFGLGQIRTAYDTSGFSTQAAPLLYQVITPNTVAVTIPTGTTVREAIRLVYTSWANPDPSVYSGRPLMATVDFTYGLRTWRDYPGDKPTDYGNVTIVDTGSGTAQGEDLHYAVDTGGVVRAVLVNGTGARVTVDDGSGLMGQCAVINDTSLTTTDQVTAAGLAYLAAFQSGLRGSLHQSDRVANQTLHAGSVMTVTDARVGLATYTTRAMQIEKRFNPGNTETWTYDFGGFPPSGAALMRRLTRATLS